jgi:hypothetical protein
VKLTMLVGALAALSALAWGQSKSATVEDTLKQMERDWAKADQNRDSATLDRIIEDDWTGITFEGRSETKADAMADLKDTSTTLANITLGEMKVKVFGNTAVVQGSDVEKSSYKGKDTSGTYMWMDVFALRNGKWQAVASESTKVAK